MGIDRYGLQFLMKDGLYLDQSGKGNTITNNGATLTADHNGRAGRGWRIYGENLYIAVPNVSFFSGSGKFHLQYSYYQNTGLLSGRVFRYYVDAQNYLRILHQSVDKYILVEGLANNVAFSVQTVNNKFALKNWYMIDIELGRTDGNKIMLNNEEATLVTNNFTTQQINGIGTFYMMGWGTNYVEMDTDYIALYNRILAESQRLKLYNYWRTH